MTLSDLERRDAMKKFQADLPNDAGPFDIEDNIRQDNTCGGRAYF